MDLTCPEDNVIVGSVFMEARPVIDEKSTFTIGMSCLNVKDVELFGKSDPFLILSRPNDTFINTLDKKDIPETGWQVLYTTEWKKNELNPKYAPISISSWYLTRGNPDAILKVEIMHHNNIRKHKKIGTCYTSVNKILSEADRYVNAFCKKSILIKEKFAGTLHFYSFIEKKNLTIKEYADKGINCRTILAIDCTRSILNPTGNMLQVAANEFLIVNKHQPEDSVLKSPRNDSAEGMKELSVIDPPKEASNTLAADTVEENKVEVVKESQKPVVPIVTDLETVMKPMEDLINILLKHESQQRCGVFGFGARIGGCRYPIFPLNQNERHPALKSKEEAKEVLTKLTEHLVPEEPTKLSPVIQRAIIMCKHQDRHKSYKVYTLLVILTDGEIADTQDTVDSIVEASNFPISIVFVGLKGSNYDVLDYLNTGQDKTDAKKTALKNPQEPQKNEPKKNLSRLTDSKGKMGVRKVTTLVNYTPFKDNLAGLEDAILKAIPLQMMQYYNLNKEIQERRNLLTVSMSDDKLGSDASGRNSPGLPSPVAPKSETTTEERALESPVKTDP